MVGPTWPECAIIKVKRNFTMCELKASDLHSHKPCESGTFEILKFLVVNQIHLKAPGQRQIQTSELH